MRTSFFCSSGSTFQSTLPARGATPCGGRTRRRNGISIHAPRTGSDGTGTGSQISRGNFNPRSPHGERQLYEYRFRTGKQFQSTLPARGATVYLRRLCQTDHISIHAPRTGSDSEFGFGAPLPEEISIHAPRTGSDKNTWTNRMRRLTFQSTLPARGATPLLIISRRDLPISIHAPRTGSDRPVTVLYSVSRYFNPRSPHGERRGQNSFQHEANYFNPRSPHGERRNFHRPHCECEHFNPRSPHGERRWQVGLHVLQGYFNPRSPHGERLWGGAYE